MTDQKEGLRYNEGKIAYDHIPLHLLEDAARVFKYVTERKTKPYPKWNWLLDKPVTVAYGALLRHLIKWYKGEDIDEETGLPHLGHALCNILMLIQHSKNPDNDDRPKEYFAGDKACF